AVRREGRRVAARSAEQLDRRIGGRMARCLHHSGGHESPRRIAGDLRLEAAARPRVKIAVVGAGAIGGYVGGWLAAAGEDVTFIARGANLAAIRQNGMRVTGEDGAETVA